MLRVTLDRFLNMSTEEIKEGPCMELVDDADGHVAYIIVGAEQEMRDQITARASMIDAARGKA